MTGAAFLRDCRLPTIYGLPRPHHGGGDGGRRRQLNLTHHCCPMSIASLPQPRVAASAAARPINHHQLLAYPPLPPMDVGAPACQLATGAD